MLENGAALDLVLRGAAQGSRAALPFQTRSVGLESRLSWQLEQGARASAYAGVARNKIFDPARDLSAVVTPDLGASNRGYVGADYSGVVALDGAVSGLRYSLGAEIAALEDGKSQARLRGDMQIGGLLADGAIGWRADLRGGVLGTSCGASGIGDRFILGGATLRGFEYGGFGPHDGAQALGGNRYAVARFDVQFPHAFGTDALLVPGLHADIGSLWGLDETHGVAVDDSAHLRSSVGVTLAAKMGNGALSLSASHAVDTEANDQTQPLQIRFDSKF